MATLNIYLNDELKARMARHDSINWSQIAASAISTAIDIEERKEVDMDQASIERLRASREIVGHKRGADAEAKGKTWALSTEYEDLERVAALEDQSLGDDDGVVVYALAKALLGDENPSLLDLRECFEPLFGTHELTDSQALAFIAGAAAVFAEV